MKKVILVKKDPNKAESADNWIVMNSYEFAMFMKTPEGQKRKQGFAMLYGCDSDDVIIIAECGEENVPQWRADVNRADYLRTRNLKHGNVVFSYHGIQKWDEDEICGEDFLKEERKSVEETVIVRLMKEELRLAIMSLSAEDRDLIDKMFLSERPMTELEYAESIGLERHQVDYRKKQVLKKLRGMLGD